MTTVTFLSKLLASLMRNYFPKRTSAVPRHTLSKLLSYKINITEKKERIASLTKHINPYKTGTWTVLTRWHFFVECRTHRGEGGNLPWFRYRRAAGVPGPHPIHILGEVKKHTRSYTSQSENYTHSYSIFQTLPIYILIGWKRYDIDILLKWKWYPSIYLFFCILHWRPEKYTPSSRTSVYIPL